MEAELIRIAGIGIVGAVLAVVIKENKPEMAVLVGLAFGVMALAVAAGKASAIIGLIDESIKKSGIDSKLIVPVFKVIGLAYITQFSVDACRDAGQQGIASKVEIVGKIMMLAVAVPIATALIGIITTII
jgi:stage III sporulation protein AD